MVIHLMTSQEVRSLIIHKMLFLFGLDFIKASGLGSVISHSDTLSPQQLSYYP